jgi:cytidine deaminase
METLLSLTSDWKTLADEAAAAALRAYAPYSGFRVGAAVDAAGTCVPGTNIENATFGATVCAERIALGAARALGYLPVTRLALSFPDAPSNAAITTLVPCGICRQWLVELAPNCRILVAGPNIAFDVSEIFPYPFKLA